MTQQATSGSAARLGAHVDGDGVNFAVFSANAERMELCLFSPDGKRETARLTLPERSGSIWHGHVAGLKPGRTSPDELGAPMPPSRLAT